MEQEEIAEEKDNECNQDTKADIAEEVSSVIKTGEANQNDDGPGDAI